MLEQLFLRILDITRIGSVVILAVLIARLLLKRVPKAVSYGLWLVVLLRLLFLPELTSPMSILPEMKPVADDYALAGENISFAEAGMAAYQAVGDALNGGLGVQHIMTEDVDEHGYHLYVTTDWGDVWILFGQYVWIAGMAGMLVYSSISYAGVRKKLRVRVRLRDNIYLADDIGSPCVVGLVRPEICLPDHLGKEEQEYILLHEQQHIRRGDHIWKALGFLALSVHWFNPLVWLAFVFASKDMEMSCDEAVLRKLGDQVRDRYCASLLTLATGKRVVRGTPLAFGEGNTGSRIRNLAKWKKPVMWVTAAAVICCAVLSACLLTDPPGEEQTTQTTEEMTQTETTLPRTEIQITDPTLDVQPPNRTETTEPDETDPDKLPETLHSVEHTLSLEELPADYSPEQAAADGCVVMIGGDIWANTEIWSTFVVMQSRGVPASVRCADFRDDPRETRIYDITSAGFDYTYRCLQNEEITQRTYPGLHVTGNIDPQTEGVNGFKVWALSDNGLWGMYGEIGGTLPYDSSWGDETVIVWCDLIQYREHPAIPASLSGAEITLDGKTVASVTDPEKLARIREFFAAAEGYPNEPKTYVSGPALTLVGTNGQVVVGNLDRMWNSVRIDSVFYFYGNDNWNGDERFMILDMLSLFDLPDWPEWFYTYYREKGQDELRLI